MLRKFCLCFAGVAAASVASGLIVVVIEPVTSAGAHGANQFPLSINRALKGDRLKTDQLPLHIATQPRAPTPETARPDTRAPARPAAKKTPVGCDPSFSPVASPLLAGVFGRCMT
jgi:hypothetical protein